MSNIQNKLRIKFVNNDSNKNQQKSNAYKIAFKNNNVFPEKTKEEQCPKNNISFKINDRVIHNDEKIIGKVSFVSDDKVSIIWEDHTRERFPISEIGQLSIYNDELDKTVVNEPIKETIVDAEVRKISNNTKPESSECLSDIDKLYSKAFSEMEDEYDDIIDANPNKLKEQMLRRQVDTMERKLENKQINNIKEQSVDELISLMKDKNMISDSEESTERDRILKMSDTEFNNFKREVISGKSSNIEVELTEAEKMLQRIKFGGPVIGDFSKQPGSFSSGETRSLAGGQNRSLETVASKNETNGLNFDGFRDLQGITKPLQVVSEQKSPRQNISDAISNLNWTTLSKMF